MRTPDWQAEATIDPLLALDQPAAGRTKLPTTTAGVRTWFARPKRLFLSSHRRSSRSRPSMIGGLYGCHRAGGRGCVHHSVHVVVHTDPGTNFDAPGARSGGVGRVRLVPHIGFEPMISALRGRCPGPL